MSEDRVGRSRLRWLAAAIAVDLCSALTYVAVLADVDAKEGDDSAARRAPPATVPVPEAAPAEDAPLLAPSSTVALATSPEPLDAVRDQPTEVSRPPENDANPFGISIGWLAGDLSFRLAVADDLGARFVRMTAALDDDGFEMVDGHDPALARAAAFEVALNVRYYGASAESSPSCPGAVGGTCESVPADLDSYQRIVGDVVDRHAPAIVVVGNEENLVEHFPGTAEQYGAELAAACAAARQRATPCTNGGLLSGTAVLLTYQHYRETGQGQRADSYRERAFEDFQQGLSDEEIEQRLVRAREFVAVYRTVRPDYVNFHWYGSDAAALSETIGYLEGVTGLPAVTNEIGQRVDDAEVTTSLMTTVVAHGIDVAIWYNSDLGPAGPRALVDRSGGFRPAGEAFSEFIRSNFP